ncbi:6-phosphogluconolactonase [Streptomyces anulatus]
MSGTDLRQYCRSRWENSAPQPWETKLTTSPIRCFATAEEASANAASTVADAIRKAVSQRGECVLALTGGNTPVDTYRLLAAMDVPWGGVQVVQTDDRVRPHTETGSNWRMICRTLLDPASVPEDRRHPMPVDAADPEAAAAEYAKLLQALAPDGGADVVLLQLGPDGHLASLFHNRYDPQETSGTQITTTVDGAVRMTQTLRSLRAAKTRVLLATGGSKTEAVEKVRSGTADTFATRTFLGPDGLLLLDAAAAGQVR